MRRGFGSTHGSLATVALLVVLLTTIGIAGLTAAPRANVAQNHVTGVPHSAAPAVVAAAPKPAVGPVSVVITITNNPSAYIMLPWALNWSMTITNGSVATGTTWMSVSVSDVTGSGVCVQAATCPVIYNQSVPVVTGTTSYSYTLTAFNVTVAGTKPLTQDEFLIAAWVTANNTVSNLTFGSSVERFIVPGAITGGFVAPNLNSAVSTGNVTVGINYTGSYVSGATVQIFSGTTTAGALVFSQGVFAPGVGAHTVIAASVWFVSVPGTYHGLLTVSAPYGSWHFQTNWTVIAAGTTIYQNSSSWQNQTLIPGLSPAVGGTVLLVVGLLVGIIVAMALGRMVWGGSKATPAQPWQAKPATNECSVCHQTFATEAELKDHAKTAHGM